MSHISILQSYRLLNTWCFDVLDRWKPPTSFWLYFLDWWKQILFFSENFFLCLDFEFLQEIELVLINYLSAGGTIRAANDELYFPFFLIIQ